MRRLLLCCTILLFAFASFSFLPQAVSAQSLEKRPPAISGGAEAHGLAQRMADLTRLKGSPTGDLGAGAFIPGVGFLAYNFDDNVTETGFMLIPPDPIGSAGADRLISVVNVGIECRNKAGGLIFRDALRDFFSPLGAATLGTLTFDPKVVYDHYENRFVIVALERWLMANGDPSDESRILVAVSKTSSPATATAADWWYLAINSKVNINGNDNWADYPGFEVDEEAVYITNSMFPFTTGTYGVRLWIIDKGVAGGFYAGGPVGWNIYNPIPSGFQDMTTMPALVFGAGGVAPNVGTFLVGYSSLTYGGPGANELVQIIRVDNPLTGPTFSGQYVVVGDLEDVGGIYGFPAIPDAPQLGTASLIEVNDSRALDAVWRNNRLWITTTLNPNVGYDAINNGEATAHWFKLDTSALGAITVTDQGNIGGEDIASDASTFFPAVAVNGLGDAMFGYSASAASMYCGAYCSVREPGDPAGTVQIAGTVQVGLDFYLRTFGGPRNRWGDYSGASVDPVDDTTFWIYNEYAETRGTGTAPEDGRWGTAWKSALKQSALDFGDAPDPTYPTLLSSNGARHTIVQNIFMGTLIDGEPDGLPHPNALGDDITNQPDEDGVFFVTPFIPGLLAQVDVFVSVPGWLDIWFDFNQDGTWQHPGEQVYSGPVVGGLNPIPFTVPVGAFTGPTFARFRFNTSGALRPDGPAPDGEVEDYEVYIEEPQEELDFGDAPDRPYPTLLANNGAHHFIVPNVFMGALIDAEPDGQPHPNALGDDLNNLPDEDGVNFVTPFIQGQPAQVDVIVSVPGWLDIWFDFNFNGSWLDAGEQVYSGPAVPGLNPINFTVPASAFPGLTFARFRYNTGGPLPVTGFAQDGEVEDYEVPIEEPELDFGDAPDPTYPTLLASNGARHLISPNAFMGALIDAEPNGQPNATATGDDLANLPDEDGVVAVTPFVIGAGAQVNVTVSAPGWLDVWFDYNQNGSWIDPGELVFSGPVVAGLNPIGFTIPVGTLPGATFARYRYNTGGALSVDGIAPDGEVEDYLVRIEEPQEELDFGDAPDPTYPTLLANNGARHTIIPNAFMGALIDAEPDGQPNATATGDDLANLPDEDGVAFPTPLIPGSGAQVDVTVSVGGWLDVWFDFNLNGSWLDPGEKVYSGVVVAGLNPIPFTVPASAASGLTFARFRYNVGGLVLAPTGAAPDGEVEDYEVFIEEPQEQLDFGDAPDRPYPTLLANNGARHTINPNAFMGALIDAEPDGQPNATATGDDLANLPDEDGVNFVTPFIPGLGAQVDVIVSLGGWLDVWFDFNQNGSWLDPGEMVYSGVVVAGLNPIPFTVPASAVSGQTFARFRYNLAGIVLAPTGPAPDGEVEDYEVLIEEPQEELDFGDAPDTPFPTLLVNNGARHVINPNYWMGALIDSEPDGQPNPTATGDDIANQPDEDGVVFATPLDPFYTATVNVTVSAFGHLDAWIDFDADGNWTAAEQIFVAQPVNPGLNPLSFTVPTTGSPAFITFARFRYSIAGGLPPDGLAPEGEVEDYEVRIEEDRVTGATDNVPSNFALHDAVPNPFNPQTTLSFSLPTASRVQLTIYDVNGHVVAKLLDEHRGAGRYDVVWDGRDDRQRHVSSGVYFYRIEAGSFVETKRMVLLK